MATSLHARLAFLADGWRSNVRIEATGGQIASVEVEAAPRAGDERHEVLIPGMPNLHSHAFQRGMAGLAEVIGPSADSFWTWRELMYRFALAMDPDQVEAIATQLYVEMLEAGFTRVGEFHYLHHDRDGAPYANIAEMATRIAAASERTGLNLTLLPVYYAHANFGGVEPLPEQRRFISELEGYARTVEASREAIAGLEGAVLGMAPHSLRAVTPDELMAVTAIVPDGPIHIHVAEQEREVADCLAWSGQRPVQWLLDHLPVDGRWCLIHATHLTTEETARLAASGATAGLCPVTEANLGDGIFPAREFVAHGGRYGIGSDSNIRIGVTDELRQLEYAQRLSLRARNVLATGTSSTGCSLYDAAWRGGQAALGGDSSGVAAGAPFDMVSLATDLWEGEGEGDGILNGWIFATGVSVDCVWAGGRKVVEGGRHVLRDEVADRFRTTMRDLLAAR
ncbi:MAG: formimidoylglutamate deiminase [Chloroflexota bacterium]|nr:formimidoylglutamate deiminase [Chloroflexota bacterium]